MKTVVLSALLFLTLSFSSTAQQWKIAEGHNIAFSNSDVAGVFKELSGSINFDPSNLTSSKFVLKINVASISTGNALQNKHAKGEEWFDSEKHPTIEFISSKIEKTESGYTATGKLDIRGVKKEVKVPITFVKKGNKGTFVAKFSVNRMDYGVGKKGDVNETLKINATIPVVKK